MKRLFVAIALPKSIKNRLENLREPVEGVRWQPAEQMHLTLKFLGNTAPGDEEELRKSLRKIEAKEFVTAIQGFGFFPSPREPKVFWADVSSTPKLLQLHQSVEEAAVSLGFQPAQRPFVPHVTLARIKPPGQSNIKTLAKQHNSFGIKNIAVEEFVLFESKLKPDGAVHQPIETFKLG